MCLFLFVRRFRLECSRILYRDRLGIVRVSILVISRRYLSQSAFLYLKIWMNFGGGGGRWALKEEFRDKGFVVGCDGGAYE
jgi:hypothetical protein